jgi:hypothetical protein
MFGKSSPYSTVQESSQGQLEVDFYGVVTFEIDMSEIVGMEYTNALIENSSRFVFEARTVIKKSF